MALEYGPFNGLENAWDAYDFAEFFKLFFGNGVFPNPSNNLQVVTNANMQTKVSVGVGFVQGHKIKNTSDFILQHDIADGVLKRIDRVVMRANFLQNKGEIIIKKGTAASSPVAPTLVRNTDYYELALADVLINNGATVITQANITDQRLNTTLCGVVATNINQLDTSTLALQYQSWYNQTTNDAELDIETFKDALELSFNQWMEQEQQDFESWLDSLKDILDENVAATLATRLTTVEGDVGGIDTRLTQHLAQNSSLTTKGHVQLSNDTNSTSEVLAPTMKALNEVKQYANDIKTKWASVVGSPLNANDTQAQLESKTQTIKNTLASNLTTKGIITIGTEDLEIMVSKILNLTSAKFAKGSVTTASNSGVTVSNLSFEPDYVVIKINAKNTVNHFIFMDNKGTIIDTSIVLYTSTTATLTSASKSGFYSITSNGFSFRQYLDGTYNYIAIKE